MMQIDQLCAYLEGKSDALSDKDRREFYSNLIKKRWRSVVEKHQPYNEDETQIINFPPEERFTASNPPELSFNQLFVYADFIKPGKHQYIITYENDIIQ